LVGKDSIADALLRHFGSLKALSRASFKELRQFLPKGKAEAVMAALSRRTAQNHSSEPTEDAPYDFAYWNSQTAGKTRTEEDFRSQIARYGK
jgi:DNA repair protein RadC